MESRPAAEGLRERRLVGPSGSSVESSAGAPRPASRGTPRPLHPQVIAAEIEDVLNLLLVFRFINSLCVRTFFQPDEYFQALEPAWSIAFGSNSGAWLTWEWQHQLRSSLHPALFGLAYKVVDGLMTTLNLIPLRATVLVALPGALQSVFAGLGDFYTWKLAMDIYGRESNAPWAAWCCSTRTFSNSLETSLTIAALCYWPWELLNDAKASKVAPLQQRGRVISLRISLVLAAIAVLLRPTNLLIWLVVLGLSLTRLGLVGKSPLDMATMTVLLREIVVCGAAVLAVSLVSDRLYFGFWTFPPYKWLYFNMVQSLAVFYGRMPWHFYLSQGVPLLTTTFLPFVLVGLYKGVSSLKGSSTLQTNIIRTLTFAALATIAVFSLISHKEIRFIYPLLPVLHILAAPYIASFFTTSPAFPEAPPSVSSSSQSDTVTLRRKLTLAYILSLNLLLAGYLTLFHQPASLSVVTFLRTDFERLHPDSLSLPGDNNQAAAAATATSQPPDQQQQQQPHELFALFLTPCHSTPWRSHLVYPALRARALTCEPPLHTAPGSAARAAYLDEADRFYLRDDQGSGPWPGPGYGVRFLAEEMWPATKDGKRAGGKEEGAAEEVPRYIVGFEGIEPVLTAFFDGPGKGMGVRLRRVWSAWNGPFNEDWRRRGRLVVWDTGIYPGSYRGTEEAEAEAEETRGRERVIDEL
ncbi:glycosyltransferase family 22 protein [Thermothielavioides terrestris NRRL 8126]|uniref:Mannosyltransferase n=1 Tax=Thermothielavioides terrestris (strain ATCC 38088 / NRRL 8126) TaxID=578455 RepID=G2R9W7_THETT|nr:glycosyltransferase family 22 protein [Thermothielavioides terrestris NRRL 8126]AEO69608.1 glycosyltransferase family 22 protein [Thermothielavioides terrestris NRRL 8126]